MSQTVIPTAFERWKAQQAIDNQPIVLDEFVLAYVPDLDHNAPIDRMEALPPEAQIVHRQAVNKTGIINDNAVVYSFTMGTEIGDFVFNWIGLINRETETVAMIVHVPTQRKIANQTGQQGNALTRSFLMQYNGAAAETGITTPAETWQIDFTARLSGIDELQRWANLDHYGSGAFFGDGFLVDQNEGFFVHAGLGYVGGLRAVLPENHTFTAVDLPTKVWVDVSYQGNVVSQWETVISITTAMEHTNYNRNGFQHYVFAVASIDSHGTITDLRPIGTITDTALAKHTQSRNHPDASLMAKGFVQLSSATDSTSEEFAATPKAVKVAVDSTLAKSQNGADIPDKGAFRQNLGLKGTALLDVGTTAGTIAAGDDSRIVNSISIKNVDIQLPGRLTGNPLASTGRVYASESFLETDGNINGTRWGGWLSSYIESRWPIASVWFDESPRGWHLDRATGMLMQWGHVKRTADATAVNFYVTFPNHCAAVHLTQTAAANGSGSGSNLRAQAVTSSSFAAVMYANERSAFWLAIGF